MLQHLEVVVRSVPIIAPVPRRIIHAIYIIASTPKAGRGI